jgi:hypothetical protein
MGAVELDGLLWSAGNADRSRWAAEVLSLPPIAPHIVRVRPLGDPVARFIVPLELVRPQNRTRRAADWVYVKLRNDLFACMVAQHRPRLEPLSGRPFVRCIRFSSAEPDRYNDGFKAAIDVLCVAPPLLTKAGMFRKRRPQQRLGFLRDDSNRWIDLHQTWEPAPPKKGFGLIDVFTGES